MHSPRARSHVLLALVAPWLIVSFQLVEVRDADDPAVQSTTQLQLRRASVGLMEGETASIVGDCEGPECVQKYVDLPDSEYSWYDTGVRLNGTNAGVSWKGYVLNMTSQRWRTKATVDFPLWWHTMVVVVPSKVDHTDWATMSLDFGYNGPHGYLLRVDNRDPNDKRESYIQEVTAINSDNLKDSLELLKLVAAKASFLACKTRAVGVSVLGLPNGYETFGNDVMKMKRSFDFLKAWSWRDYMKHGAKQPERIIEVATAKAVVRAMDTVEDFTRKQLGGPVARFGIAAYSKLASVAFMVSAIDSRVKALTPAAISLTLGGMFKDTAVEPPGETYFMHQFKPPSSPKEFAEKFKMSTFAYEYDVMLTAKGSPEFYSLHRIVDPMTYSPLLNGTAKMFIMCTKDNIFNDVLDKVAPIWPRMTGPKALKFIPNCEHEETLVRSLPTTASFFRGQITGAPMPEIKWRFERAKRRISVTLASGHVPMRVHLLTGDGGEAKDFYEGGFWTAEALNMTQDGGVSSFAGTIPWPPKDHFQGGFLQLEYEWPEPGFSYQITTPMWVVAAEKL